MRHLCLECHDTACYYRGAPYPLLDKRPDPNNPWQGRIRKRAMQSRTRAPRARSDCNRLAGRLRDYTRVENDNTRMRALAPNWERLRRSPALGPEYEPFGLLLMYDTVREVESSEARDEDRRQGERVVSSVHGSEGGQA